MSVGVDGRWEAGIGDPSVLGWLTFVGYGAAAFASVNCARGVSLGREHWFWCVAAGFLLVLAANKQLDLQTLIVQIGRDVAIQQGWYAERRSAQLAFIVMLLAVAAASAAWLWFHVRGLAAVTRVAAFGLAMLVIFTGVRGSSFHHIDQLLGTDVDGVLLHRLMEVVGVTLVLTAAVVRWRGFRAAASRRTASNRMRRRLAAGREQ